MRTSKRSFPLALLVVLGAVGCTQDTPVGPVVEPEMYIMPDPCAFDPELCHGGSYDWSGGLTLPSNITYPACRSGAMSQPDKDHDGFGDECEYQIAAAFSPYMLFHPKDKDASREPYWAAYPDLSSPLGVLKIFYAPAYHLDTGMDGHYGDSEFIILTVRYHGASKWALLSAKTSAHWGVRLGDATETTGYGGLEYPPNGYRGPPLVYVAKDKHGNYRSRNACEAGAYTFDDCSLNSWWGPHSQARVDRDRNLGNSWGRLRNCTSSYDPVTYPGQECFWTGEYFRGWYMAPNSASSGGYKRSLLAHGF